MIYKTSGSLYKLICTDYVDFEKNQDHFGRLSVSKNDSNYSVVNIRNMGREDNRDFRQVSNLNMEGSELNVFLQLRNQIVVVVKSFGRDQKKLPTE